VSADKGRAGAAGGRGTGLFLWSLSLAQLVSWGILFYSIAVFFVPMREELGWSKAVVSGGITIGLVSSGIFAPWVGAQVDRGNAWPVLTGGSVLGSAAVLAWPSSRRRSPSGPSASRWASRWPAPSTSRASPS